MQTYRLISCALGAFLASAPLWAVTETSKPATDPSLDADSSLIDFPSPSAIDKDLFLRIDADGDGTLSLDELNAARAEGLLPT